MNVLEELKKVEGLGEVPEDQLQWLVEQGSLSEIAEGEFLFQPGDPIDRMQIVLSGSFVIKVHQNNQFRVIANIDEKRVTGLLPYSRAKQASGSAEATAAATVLSLHRDQFKQMITEHEELTTALVHVMSTRIREFTKLQQQNDKMVALGKISAGLAHELNNPSAAVVRSAQELKRHLSTLPEKFKEVVEIKMNEEQIDRVNHLLFSKLESETEELSLMEKSEKEDEFLDWLEDRDIDEAEEIAENMVDFGFSPDDLSTIDEDVPPEHLAGVINWVNQVLTTEKLVSEIEDASQRISDLVKSVKSYTHMDQSPEKKMASVHEGIDNTLTMLKHKLKKEEIEVIKEYDESLSEAEILPSSLNQVWTNLIDNAIDAMKGQERKVLTLKTVKDAQFVNVHVIDSGAGIPDDVIDHIFDPFFTTKEIGEGTGIGLEVSRGIIVKDHRGSLTVESKPGQTNFKACFPIKA